MDEHKQMDFKETYELNPIDKYRKYGIFPWKMLTHFLLVIFTACQILLISNENNKFSRTQERFIYNMFIDESDKRDLDYKKQIFLYTIPEIKEHLNKSVNNYYNLKSKSLEKVEYPVDHYSVMEVDYISMIGNKDREYFYRVDNYTLGPFDESDDNAKQFINGIIDFRMNYTFYTYVPFYFNNNYDCNFWNIIQTYDFCSRAHFIVRINIDRQSCQNITPHNIPYINMFINKLLWIHLIVIALATISLIMTWNYIRNIASMYMRVKSKYGPKKDKFDNYNTKSDESYYYNPLLDQEERKKMTEEDEELKDIVSDMNDAGKINIKNKKQIKIVNNWNFICLIGNITQIFASALTLFDSKHIGSSTQILIGFSCMLAFINIGRYIEYSQSFSTLYVTLRAALPNVIRYLIGVLPVFLGFIFFGVCIFWKSERFTSISDVTVILFSLAQGDSVFDTFKDLKGFSFVLGQIYLYSFCILFIVVVLNIFIAILEEAYVQSKMENKSHWVYDYLHEANSKQQKVDNIVLKKETGEKKMKSRFSDNQYSQSVKNEPNELLKKHVKFDQAKSYVFEPDSATNETKKIINIDINDNNLKNLEIEFNNIDETLDDIKKYSTRIISSNNAEIDEIRTSVFDLIGNIDYRIQLIREVLTKNY